MVVAESRSQSSRFMQLDGRCRQLRSVWSLGAARWSLRAAEVGRSLVNRCPWFWYFVGMVESWLLARNSKSLRGLVVAMLGQSVTVSRYVDWMLHCKSIVVSRSISRFWQYVGLTGGVSIWLLARNSESLRGPDAAMLSFTVAMALLCQIAVQAYCLRELWLCRAKAVWTSQGGRYGCFAPKLCGRIEAIAKAVSHRSCADASRR